MTNIKDIPQIPMDGYDAARYLYGVSDSKTATMAYVEMRKAGWVFYTYNEYGEEVWAPPDNN